MRRSPNTNAERATGEGPAAPSRPRHTGGLLEIGVVGRPHGIRGEVRVQVHDPNGTALGELPAVVLRPHGEAGAPPPRRIDAVRRAPDGTFVVAFHGIATRNDAEALRGMLVLAARADLRPPGAGEWYAADLVGLQAVAPDGRPLGRVRDVYANGAQEVLVVAAAGGDVDVPFVDAHVGEVDLDAGRLVIVDIDALRIAPGPGSPEP